MATIDLKNKKIQKLVRDVKSKCIKNDIKFILTKGKFLQYKGEKLSGSFDDSRKELIVAGGSNDSLETLIHEDSHLDQWIENSKYWNCTNINHKGILLESNYLIDAWLINTIDINSSILDRMFKGIMDCERNCEKRTINKIKKYKLDNLICVKEYAKKANSYILGYTLVKQHRSWFKNGNMPYLKPDVYNQFPDKILNSYTLPPKVKAIMQKNCF